MKKLFIVSKTHLDLGYTDFAEAVRKKYINQFIPNSIKLAHAVNKDGKKNFVWTTGSWILKEALENGTEEQKKSLKEALINGDIVPHAMPFTTHTELLDEDTLEYGLSIVDKLDELRGRKTIAAKMTDVPGHTRSLVRILAKHGIKFLHIGVNDASAVPDVPKCFRWQSGDSEIIVSYSDDYGGVVKCDAVDEILYIEHARDNGGVPDTQKFLNKIRKIHKDFPDYEVVAGTLDDYAEILWENREKLPVVDTEIGDSWIHGSASDPYKSAALREMMSLKRKWLKSGTLEKNSDEYVGFTDNLLCIAEHTCGRTNGDFRDFEHYLKKDFQKERKNDTVKIRNIFSSFPFNFAFFFNETFGKSEKRTFSRMEKSWEEQRDYINKAVSFLSPEHKKEALEHLSLLRPEAPENFISNDKAFNTFECGEWSLTVNKFGGIKELTRNGKCAIKNNDKPILEYRSFSNDDYKFWLDNYVRDIERTGWWAVGDFARPRLKKFDKKYPKGRFAYTVKESAAQKSDDSIKIYVNLECEKRLCDEVGAPRLVQIVYTLTENGIKFDVSWFNKDANRLTEAIYLHLYPQNGKITFRKIGEEIDPLTVVKNGGRNLHAAENIHLKTKSDEFRIINRHSPITSLGKGKILKFDNVIEDFSNDGITYVLCNNVWGTNFPLWYEDNARFTFEITDENSFIDD